MSSTLTGGQLGGLCGVSRQAIAQAKKKGILFTDSDGLYNPEIGTDKAEAARFKIFKEYQILGGK
jgi:hypothetical protein